MRAAQLRCTKKRSDSTRNFPRGVASKTNRGKDDENAFNDLSSGTARYHVCDSGVGRIGRFGTNCSGSPGEYGSSQSRMIAQLREASGDAVREGRTGNKNNPVFGQKSAQINDLIERLQSGQKVDPSEIDQAFEPARVW